MKTKTIIILLLSWNFLFSQEEFRDLSQLFQNTNEEGVVSIVSNRQLQELTRFLSLRVVIQIGEKKQALLKDRDKTYVIKEKEIVYIPIEGEVLLKKNFEVLAINKRSVVLKHIQTKKNITIL